MRKVRKEIRIQDFNEAKSFVKNHTRAERIYKQSFYPPAFKTIITKDGKKHYSFWVFLPSRLLIYKILKEEEDKMLRNIWKQVNF